MAMQQPYLQISFRRIAPRDINALVRWQLEPEIAVWWNHENHSEARLREEWKRKTAGGDGNTDRYITVVNGQDIGEIQVFDVSTVPKFEAQAGILDAAGVDILIGEPEWRNRGVGTAVMCNFIRDYVFTRPSIKTCTIDPDPENLRAIRTYEKAGFRYVKTFHSDEDDVDVYLMRMDEPPPLD